jgi:hypothetical protein
MGKPDALSRRADHHDGQQDNQNRTMLPPTLFRARALSAAKTKGEGKEILHEIRQSMRNAGLEEPVAKAAVNLRKDHQRGQVRLSEWEFEGEDLLLFNGRVYVPDTGDIRRKIIKQHHDSLVAGHPGRWKTLELVSRNYWWPNMSRMIGRYTSTCNICLRNKILRRKPLGELHPIQPPKERWSRVTVDFIGELPRAHGFNAIMACVDSVSKQAHFIPTITKVDAPGTAALYRDHVWKLHGLPEEVLTDRGSQFASAMLKELYGSLGI